MHSNTIVENDSSKPTSEREPTKEPSRGAMDMSKLGQHSPLPERTRKQEQSKIVLCFKWTILCTLFRLKLIAELCLGQLRFYGTWY